jgi:hypothetical protein
MRTIKLVYIKEMIPRLIKGIEKIIENEPGSEIMNLSYVQYINLYAERTDYAGKSIPPGLVLESRAAIADLNSIDQRLSEIVYASLPDDRKVEISVIEELLAAHISGKLSNEEVYDLSARRFFAREAIDEVYRSAYERIRKVHTEYIDFLNTCL